MHGENAIGVKGILADGQDWMQDATQGNRCTQGLDVFAEKMWTEYCVDLAIVDVDRE